MILLVLGIWIVARETGKRSVQCPTHKVVVKYLPRTAEEEETNRVDISDMFRDMFAKSSPWIATSTDEALFTRKLTL
jgi:hypothetical protein